MSLLGGNLGWCRPSDLDVSRLRGRGLAHGDLVNGCHEIRCSRLGAWGSGNVGRCVRCWRACGVVASPSRPGSGGRGRPARRPQWRCPRLGRGRLSDVNGGRGAGAGRRRGAGRPSAEQPTHRIPDGWVWGASRWATLPPAGSAPSRRTDPTTGTAKPTRTATAPKTSQARPRTSSPQPTLRAASGPATTRRPPGNPPHRLRTASGTL